MKKEIQKAVNKAIDERLQAEKALTILERFGCDDAENPSCSTCLYFVFLVHSPAQGQCKFNPSSLDIDDPFHHLSWCGQWMPKPEKK